MTSHQLLESHGPNLARRRWYVDGVQVSFAVYYRLHNRAGKHDCFQTVRRGSRWLHYSRVSW